MSKYKLDQLFSYMLHIIHKNIPGFKVSFDIGKRVLDKTYLFWWDTLDVKYTILIILHLTLPFFFSYLRDPDLYKAKSL